MPMKDRRRLPHPPISGEGYAVSTTSRIRELRRSLLPILECLIDRHHREADDWSRRQLEDEYLRRIDELLSVITAWQQTKFRHLGTTHEDLMQWARLAALEAIQRFDTSRGTDFCAYLISYVRRFVYNKVLDELPVPRMVSKEIRRYTAMGVSVSCLPDHLRKAAMLRAPVQVDCLLIGQSFVIEQNDEDSLSDVEERDLAELISCIGEREWDRICDWLQNSKRNRSRIEAAVRNLSRLEVPPHLQTLKDNLIDYLRRKSIC